jgi:hypothetical protein
LRFSPAINIALIAQIHIATVSWDVLLCGLAEKYNFQEPAKPYSVKKMEGRTSLINVSALLPDYKATNSTEKRPS